jgi:hypothetical protein
MLVWQEDRGMKAYLIDSAAQTITEIEYSGLAALQSLIGGYIEVAWTWQNGDVVYVDEEGLLKPQSAFFRLAPRRDGQPLAGNGVLVGREQAAKNADGYITLPPTTSLDALRSQVQFLSYEQVQAWAKGNASEPAVVVSSQSPDGRETRDVVARFGRLYGDIPKKR